MRKTEATTQPTWKKINNVVHMPYNCSQKDVTHEDGTTQTIYEYFVFKETFCGYSETSLEHWKSSVINMLRQDNSEYILSNYDMGAQSTLQSILNDTKTIAGTKKKVKEIWSWIRTTDVLPYYYMKKNDIKNITTVDELINITWDFNQFDATKPAHTLESLI